MSKQIILTGRKTNNDILANVKNYNTRSVFGFSYIFSPLYGGRENYETNIIHKPIVEGLYDQGIGFDLTLTNHHFSEELYRDTLPLLKEHHRDDNSLIILNSRLAIRAREDFPKYRLKASCIRRPRTLESIYKSLEIFDEVCIYPQDMRDFDFIRSIPDDIKPRIVLFGNAGCILDCSDSVCYKNASDIFAKDETIKQGCPKITTGYRTPLYLWDYETSPLFEGFDLIKLTLPKKGQLQIRLPNTWPGKSKLTYLEE